MRRAEYGHVVKGVEGPLEEGLNGKDDPSCFTMTSTDDARDVPVDSLHSDESSSTSVFMELSSVKKAKGGFVLRDETMKKGTDKDQGPGSTIASIDCPTISVFLARARMLRR